MKKSSRKKLVWYIRFNKYWEGICVMLKKFAFMIYVLVALVVLSACNGESNEIEEGNGGFLWKVENGDTEVFLQGTIHLGEEDFYPLNPQSEDAYEQADIVMPELDLNNIDVTESQQLIMESAIYQDGTTIEDDLSEESYEELATILESYGLDMEMVESFQPWYMEMMLLQLILEESEYDAAYGVDQYFLDRAEEDGKEIIALETFEEQMDVLSGFSKEQQVSTLSAAIEGYDEMGAELDELAELWIEGDKDMMMEYEDNYEESEEYMKGLNEDRNINMADQIHDYLEDDNGETYFVIVGAMHFVEEPSIPSLLEEKGYEVEFIY